MHCRADLQRNLGEFGLNSFATHEIMHCRADLQRILGGFGLNSFTTREIMHCRPATNVGRSAVPLSRPEAQGASYEDRAQAGKEKLEKDCDHARLGGE